MKVSVADFEREVDYFLGDLHQYSPDARDAAITEATLFLTELRSKFSKQLEEEHSKKSPVEHMATIPECSSVKVNDSPLEELPQMRRPVTAPTMYTTYDSTWAIGRNSTLLSPHTMLNSIETQLHTHFSSIRKWFLSMDSYRRGYLTNDELLLGILRLGVHPEIVYSKQLQDLIYQQPTSEPGKLYFNDFAAFLKRWFGSIDQGTQLPSDKKYQRIKAQPKRVETAVGAIRFELLRRSRNLREAFLLLDSSRNGIIGFDELKQKLVEVGVPLKLVQSPAMDGDLTKLRVKRSGFLEFNEFAMLFSEPLPHQAKARIMKRMTNSHVPTERFNP